MLPKCRCGSRNVYVKRQVIGWVVTRFNEMGEMMDQSYDNVAPGRAGILRCSGCAAPRGDLEFRDEAIVVKVVS